MRRSFVGTNRSIRIQDELREQNIRISLREIDYLGKRFIVYMTLAHEQSQAELKQFMGSLGGYVLHLDGTWLSFLVYRTSFVISTFSRTLARIYWARITARFADT